MLRGLFGENKKDALLRAKEDFEAVCRLQGSSREVRAARIRMGIRCRAVIDETFLEGIEKGAEHLEQCMVAVITGDPRPPLPQAGAFQKIKTINGPVMAYIPLEEAEEVFVQEVANRISLLLQLDRPIEPLEFLSEKLEEDRAAQDLAEIRAAKQRSAQDD
jgi:hypothetical protein